MFFLAYHLHWTHADVLDLATSDRWRYVRLLGEQLQKEHDAVKDAKRH